GGSALGGCFGCFGTGGVALLLLQREWTADGVAGSSNFVATAAPAPRGFSATDSDGAGNQIYRGRLVSADPSPLRYEGDWSDDAGRTATFVFTRLD
ncbi:hypothetical protein, partial [Amycolatopsis sp. NPDC003731]